MTAVIAGSARAYLCSIDVNLTMRSRFIRQQLILGLFLRPSPPDATAEDLSTEVIVMYADGNQVGGILHDPDGHVVVVVPRRLARELPNRVRC
jgi:hypothetical protein